MKGNETKGESSTDRYIHGPVPCRSALAEALSKGGSRGELIQGAHTRLGELCPTAALDEGLELLLPEGSTGRLPDPGYPCHLTLYRSQENLYFRGDVLRTHGRTIVVRWPEGLWVYDQRANLRRALTPGVAQVRIPLPWKKSGTSYPLSDHSTRGFSFIVPVDACPFLPGTPVPELILTGLPGGVIQTSGEIRHVTPLPGGQGLKVGVLIREATSDIEGDGKASPEMGFFRRLWLRLSERFFRGVSRPISLPGTIAEERILRHRSGEAHILINETPGIPEGATPPGVVICPDLGQRKECLEPLVHQMLALFLSQGKRLRIYRVDSPRDPQVGSQLHPFPIDGWLGDMTAALAEADRACDGAPILLTQGIKGAIAAQLLLKDHAPPLRGWIALGGEPRLEGSILNWTGGVDVLGGAAPPAVVSLGGIRFSGPALRGALGTVLEANMKVAGPLLNPLPMSITWYLDPEERKTDAQSVSSDLMGGDAGPRELHFVAPGGLNLRSPRATSVINDVANRVYQTLHRRVVPPPPMEGRPTTKSLACSCTALPISQGSLLEPMILGDENGFSPYGLLGLHPLVSRVHRLLLVECLKEGTTALVGPGVGQIPFLLDESVGIGNTRATCTVLGEDVTSMALSAQALEAHGMTTRRRLGAPDPQGLADLELGLRGELPLSYALRASGLLSPRDLESLGPIDDNLELWSLLRGEALSPGDLRQLRSRIGQRGLGVARDIGRLSASLRRIGSSFLGHNGYPSEAIPALSTLRAPIRRPENPLEPGTMSRLFAPFLFPSLGGIHSTLLSLKQSLAPKGRLVFTALHPALDADRWALDLLRVEMESRDPIPVLSDLEPPQALAQLRRSGQGLMALYGGASQGDVHLPSPDELGTSLVLAGYRDIQIGQEGGSGGPELTVIRAGV